MDGGLINIGNTCYINTAIQCLLSCQRFCSFLEETRSPYNSPILKNLQNVEMDLLNRKTTVRPLALLQSLHESMKSSLNILEQNDIMEFLAIFFDRLNKEIGRDEREKMHEIISRIPYEDTSYDRQKYKMDRDWVNQTGKEYSKLCALIYGQHISQIICKSCEKIWHNYEIFQDISIAIDRDTLEECLKHHFDETTLDEWKCDKCKEGNCSKRTTLLWKNPSILIIVLKRFDFDTRCQTFVKNNKKVAIPERINIAEFCVGKTKKLYDLRSVAFHSGSYHGGHYHALCKKPDGWYLFDDDTVFKKEELYDHLSLGYVYFYEALE